MRTIVMWILFNQLNKPTLWNAIPAMIAEIAFTVAELKLGIKI